MALKSILEIDVKDDQFRDFNAIFERYRENLKTLPGQWGVIANGIGSAKTAFDDLAKKQAAATVSARFEEAAKRRAAELVRRMDRDALTGLQRIKAGTEAWGNAVGKVADQWKSVAVYSAKSGASIASATVSLLKWTSALGAVSALIGGAGGLYGIDRLALSAATARRQSMATGVPTGQQRAFDIDYGRFGDTQSITGNIATAKSDITSPQYLGLRGAGLNAEEISKRNAADLGAELFERLPTLFRKGADDPLLGAQAEARGLTSILSVDDIKRYLRASPQERQAQREAYGRDAQGLDVNGTTLRAWQDLTTQIERAKSQIETTFVTGLVPLAGPIGDASKAFTDLTAAFLKSDLVKQGIEGLAGGLEGAAKYVGTDDFKENVKHFVDDVGALAKAVADAYKWFTGWLGRDRKQDAADDAKQTALAKFDPSGDAATHGEGIWHRAFNGRSGGHPTVRSAINDDDYNARVQGKMAAFRGDGGSTGVHDPLKDLISQHETGGTGAAGYDTVYGHAERGGQFAPPKPITQMTIGEVLAYQRDMKARAGTEAFPVGRAQWVEKTLRGLTAGMDQNQIFTPELQEKLFDRSISQRMAQGPGGFRSEWASLGGVSDAEIQRAIDGRRDAMRNATASNTPSGTYPAWMDDKSRRELAGVNKALASDFLAAADATGLHFRITQGLRTQAEADANARSGRGVSDSQHLYGAAADIVMQDAQGNDIRDRGAYKRFADAFTAHSRATGGNARWLGDLPGRWGSDIVHFDQGIGYGQSHKRDPYGAGGPTAADVAAGNKEIFSSPQNPFLRASQGQHSDATVMADGTVLIHRSKGMALHRKVQALQGRLDEDAKRALEGHQSPIQFTKGGGANALTALYGAGFGDKMHREIAKAHMSNPALERAKRDAAPVVGDAARGSSGGLGLHKLQRRTGHDITINNASGANVSTIAGPASYG